MFSHPHTSHTTHTPARTLRGLFWGFVADLEGEGRTGEHPPKQAQKPPKKTPTSMPEKARQTQRQPTATRTPGKAFSGIHGALPLPDRVQRMAGRLMPLLWPLLVPTGQGAFKVLRQHRLCTRATEHKRSENFRTLWFFFAYHSSICD